MADYLDTQVENVELDENCSGPFKRQDNGKQLIDDTRNEKTG